MKKLLFLSVITLTLSSCSVTIPTLATLSDQTMLLAKNKNIKANYSLTSDIADGFIPSIAVQKNGNVSTNNETYKYATETAFKKIWSSYFQNKFNDYSEEQMDIVITLKELAIREQSTTSIGFTLLTGNAKMNVDAIATVQVLVTYNGKEYKTQYEVVASDYNETQQMSSGSTIFTTSQANPTQQKAQLLESCLNKSIIQFENFISSILSEDK